MYTIAPSKSFEVQVVDPVTDYVNLMKDIFDFTAMKKLVAR